MDFKQISLEDRQDIELAWRRIGFLDCDLAFANMLCWADSYPVEICRVGGVFVLRTHLDSRVGTVYTMPIGIAEVQGRMDGIYEMIAQDASVLGEPLKIYAHSEAVISELRQRFPDMGFCYLRSHSDYIYNRDDLAMLPGHKYQSKRNHINKFKSEYNYTYSDLQASDKQECLNLLEKWRERRVAEPDVTEAFISELDKERKSITTAFDHFDELGLIGGALKVDGKIIAFCYGSIIADGVFCTHIEKGDETFDGVFPTINELFTLHLPESVKLINREDDLGLVGLRNAKETYHPVTLLHKYIGVVMSPLMQQIRSLWLEGFPQDGPMDAEQFILTQYNEDGMLAHYEDGQLVSMLHIVPFGDTAYIYAVCTLPKYRHRGIAGDLMRQAIEKCRRQGFLRMALIPSGEQAAAWYASMGFKLSETPESFRTMDYDFGRCDGTPDIPMVLKLRCELGY